MPFLIEPLSCVLVLQFEMIKTFTELYILFQVETAAGIWRPLTESAPR